MKKTITVSCIINQYREAADTMAYHTEVMEKYAESERAKLTVGQRLSAKTIRQMNEDRGYKRELYGRRQAIGSILTEIFGITGDELQKILYEVNSKYDI